MIAYIYIIYMKKGPSALFLNIETEYTVENCFPLELPNM